MYPIPMLILGTWSKT